MSRHGGATAGSVYLQQRTYLMSVATAVECQLLTRAPQQKHLHSITSPGAGAAASAHHSSRF
jgi:hypothetical protein